MRAPIEHLVEHSPLPISVLPNAGLPINVDGEAVYPMEPDPFSDMVAEFAKMGVNVVGGCCGTRPEHLAKLYRKVHGHDYAPAACGETLRRRSASRNMRPKPPAA